MNNETRKTTGNIPWGAEIAIWRDKALTILEMRHTGERDNMGSSILLTWNLQNKNVDTIWRKTCVQLTKHGDERDGDARFPRDTAIVRGQQKAVSNYNSKDTRGTTLWSSHAEAGCRRLEVQGVFRDSVATELREVRVYLPYS